MSDSGDLAFVEFSVDTSWDGCYVPQRLATLARLCRYSDSDKRALEETREAIHVDGIVEFDPAPGSSENIRQHFAMPPRSLSDDFVSTICSVQALRTLAPAKLSAVAVRDVMPSPPIMELASVDFPKTRSLQIHSRLTSVCSSDNGITLY